MGLKVYNGASYELASIRVQGDNFLLTADLDFPGTYQVVPGGLFPDPNYPGAYFTDGLVRSPTYPGAFLIPEVQ